MCDPNKNTRCAKTECFLNGGKCYLTSDSRCGFVDDSLTLNQGWRLNAEQKKMKEDYKCSKKQ